MYGKIINDETILFNENYIIVKLTIFNEDPILKITTSSEENIKIYNPTHEQMIENDWYPIEHIDEIGEDKIENGILKIYIGHNRTVEEARQYMKSQIDAYDTSSFVNGFYYGKQELWIDKSTRVGLVNAVNSSIALGHDEITFGIQSISVTLPCQLALQMLYALEMYALACYNVTLNHKNTVDSLVTVEDIESYNYMTGYPDKLRFEV